MYGFSSTDGPRTATVERGGKAARVVLVELHVVLGLRASPSRPKSRPCATRRPSTATSRALNVAGRERRDDVPVLGGDEAHPLALALDDEARGDRLHAAGGQALHHFPPEHRRDLVAVETVEDAARLLRIDERSSISRVSLERVLDRLLRDLVEDHAPHGHLRLEHLAQMPGDRLALAVFVRREQELVGALSSAFSSETTFFLRASTTYSGSKSCSVSTPRRAHGSSLYFGGNLRGVVREVTDMADRRFDHVVGAQVARDGLRLRGRLDDHERALVCGHFGRHHSAVARIRDTRRR